jgi:hypothetical protein
LKLTLFKFNRVHFLDANSACVSVCLFMCVCAFIFVCTCMCIHICVCVLAGYRKVAKNEPVPAMVNEPIMKYQHTDHSVLIQYHLGETVIYFCPD